MKLSVGVPVYNEGEVLPALIARLMPVLDRLPGGPHEVVFADDGSTDGTLALLREASRRDARIRIIALSRNFGHQAALRATIDHATGDALVLMDGDLQDEPEVIPELVRRHLEGADVVYTRRASRAQGAAASFVYRAFYRLAQRIADVDLPLDSGDFSLLGPRVVRALRQLPERQHYLRGLRAWVGFTQVAVDVRRPARAAGRPKYTSWRLIRLAVDGLCAFSTLPLRAATLAGLVAIAAVCVYALYSIYKRLVIGAVPEGFTASLLVTTFLAGAQLLFLGVIGEYLGRVYEEVKRRPTYIVAEVVGGE